MRWFVRALFCILLIATVAPLHASAEPRLALVIANPVNDGKLVAGTLQKLGFTVTLVTDVDQKKMKRAISDFGEVLKDAGPTSSALFYYAGHGLQVDGQNYLVPVNADIRREADVDLEAVSAEAVLRQMEFAAPRTSIVILDACRNNPLSRGFRSATRGLARMDAPNGSFVAYSTAPGQTAADGTGKNSPFAAALVQEITKPGQGIEESFRNVRVRVSEATGGTQTPWDSSSLMASFYFAGDAKQAAAIAIPVPAAPAPVAPAPAAATTIVTPEPSFESPLADGTIVLSPMTQAALDEYLANPFSGQGDSVLAYFYVSVDGRAFGQSVCNVSGKGNISGAPTCPQLGAHTGRGDPNKVRAKAASACDAKAETECQMLFAGDDQKIDFKPLP